MKEWRGGRGGRREGGERRDPGRQEKEKDDDRGRERDGKRRANPPSESAWSRGKPRSLGSKVRDGDHDDRKEPVPRKFEETPQPVSLKLVPL